ncbi:MAG: SGNH/GDSL hydrolase family protein [Akkermansiaceae bacterium]|nr:SGNH/GDSL hydrolase family protein [Akkermansiaceae bacterium]
MKTKHRIILGTVAIVLATLPASAATTAFTSIYAFGDSLTDVGNVNLATAGALPGPGYFEGRYSNGPVWIEKLAVLMDVPIPTRSLTGGNNFAFAGAYTGTGGSVPTIPQQIGMFTTGGRTFGPTDLVVLWAGANDFLLGGQTDPGIPVANMTANISALAAAGAKTILLGNLPNLGDTPQLLATGNPTAIGGFRTLSQMFNAGLAGAVPTLEANLGIDIRLLDIYGIGEELHTTPAVFGITNLTEGALTSGHAADAAQYAYWDTVHPTNTVHNLFGDRAYLLVPEPGAMTLVWLFGSGLLLRRRRA